MANTRLTQKGIGGQAYEDSTNVVTSVGNWGWQALPATVDYSRPESTRLGQFGVGVAAYPAETAEVIQPITANWGWTAYVTDVQYQDPQLVDATVGNWGWTAEEPILCSQYRLGYPYSFNGDVWPTCSFNEHVFGFRGAAEVNAEVQPWGWQAFAADVDIVDPVDVTTTTGNWGWRGHPAAVSYAFDVQATISIWGWSTFPATVELPYDIAATVGSWGWRGHPTAVSYGYDVGAGVATFGWQGLPATVEVPTQDVVARRADWGWQSFPAAVRQTSMLPGDIEAIAEAVYQKLAAEGMVQQVLETWQRQGADPSYPQDIPVGVGKYITCGGMNIYIERMPDGTIRQTRQ